MADDAGTTPAAETAAGTAAVAETHISTVFFVGDRAYKLKKAVEFPFADLRSRTSRERLCHREVELNRRLSPDVYLGVADVVGPDGQPCDHLVVMRRLPPERRLAALVGEGAEEVAAALDDLGRLLARFHRTAERSASIDRAGAPAAIAGRWRANLDELRPFAGDVLDVDVLGRVEVLADAFMDGRGPLFAERVERHAVCDGHGDLQADDVFCLPDGPRVLDCIEFDDELRHVDVVDDLAFLAMDLERLGARQLVEDLLDAYEGESGATVPRALLRFYVAYRALVRAKVACHRAAQLPPDDPRADPARIDAVTLLDLCARALGDCLPRLVIVGGLPGTGKTTVATGIARTLGVALFSSDLVRKELVGLDPTTPAAAPFAGGIYTPEMSEQVYAELFARADLELGLGRSVVVDASFTSDADRRLARELAARAHAALVELRCTLPATDAARRMEERRRQRRDASDADAAIAAELAARADAWPEAAELHTGSGAHLVLAEALGHVIEPPRVAAP